MPKSKLFLLPINMGESNVPAHGIVDTGATGTILPLSSVTKIGALN